MRSLSWDLRAMAHKEGEWDETRPQRIHKLEPYTAGLAIELDHDEDPSRES
jgi:hypothetical protein